jgi:hypothetical protein
MYSNFLVLLVGNFPTVVTPPIFFLQIERQFQGNLNGTISPHNRCPMVVESQSENSD